MAHKSTIFIMHNKDSDMIALIVKIKIKEITIDASNPSFKPYALLYALHQYDSSDREHDKKTRL